MTKVCPKCSTEKSVNEFNRRSRSKDGLSLWCKECNKANCRNYYANNSDPHKQQCTEWAKRNPERRRQHRKKYDASHPKGRTPRTYATIIWRRLNSRTINGKYADPNNRRHRKYFARGIRLEMTKEELLASVIAAWPEIVAMFDSGVTPSIDRIDSDDHYRSGNVRFIPLVENTTKRAQSKV